MKQFTLFEKVLDVFEHAGYEKLDQGRRKIFAENRKVTETKAFIPCCQGKLPMSHSISFWESESKAVSLDSSGEVMQRKDHLEFKKPKPSMFQSPRNLNVHSVTSHTSNKRNRFFIVLMTKKLRTQPGKFLHLMTETLIT